MLPPADCTLASEAAIFAEAPCTSAFEAA